MARFRLGVTGSIGFTLTNVSSPKAMSESVIDICGAFVEEDRRGLGGGRGEGARGPRGRRSSRDCRVDERAEVR